MIKKIWNWLINIFFIREYSIPNQCTWGSGFCRTPIGVNCGNNYCTYHCKLFHSELEWDKEGNNFYVFYCRKQ